MSSWFLKLKNTVRSEHAYFNTSCAVHGSVPTMQCRRYSTRDQQLQLFMVAVTYSCRTHGCESDRTSCECCANRCTRPSRAPPQPPLNLCCKMLCERLWPYSFAYIKKNPSTNNRANDQAIQEQLVTLRCRTF